MILFKNTDRLEIEFENSINPRLKIILFSLAEMLNYNALGTLIVTHLVRTQKEQDDIYLSPNMSSNIRGAYLAKKWKSVHQCGRGADMGVSSLKNPEEIVKWLNNNFRYNSNNALPTAILEDLGHGSHIHIQVSSWGTKLK